MFTFFAMDGEMLDFPWHNTFVVPEFLCRSLSVHCIKDAGYEADHHLRTNGNFLWIRHKTDGKEWTISLHTEGKSDFALVRLNRHIVHPSEVPRPSVSAILDLSQHMKANLLVMLLHLWYGCASLEMMRAMANGKVKGFPPNVKFPDFIDCPICSAMKTGTLPSGTSIPSVVPRKGVCYHADFGFVNVIPICGYRAFLLIVEAESLYQWGFARTKVPPIQLLKWFVLEVRKKLGHAFNVLCTDCGGELWGSRDMRTELAEIHVQMEPTGGYN